MFVAVDAGTSAVKAVLFGTDGTTQSVARRPLPIDRSDAGWAEQDMEAVWLAVASAVREVAAGRTDVEFVSVTGQGDGCWLVNADGAPTRPAILWNDARAAPIAERWRADGTIAKGYASNGSVTFPGLANSILSWLKYNDPASLEDSARLLTCSGWLFFKLTGRYGAQVSDASAPFVAAGTQDYSADLIELYDLAGIERLLPPVLDGARCAGRLTATAAAELGLPSGTAAVVAPYDVAAATIGIGATQPGQAVAVLGTTIFTGVVTAAPIAPGKPIGSTIALGLPGRYLRFFPALNGAEVLDWWARLLGLDGPPGITALAELSVAGARGLTFLPYLSPAGERAPFLDASARGSLWNLTLEHDRADIARAVVEGLTMIIVDCLAQLAEAPRELRLSGGGARSDFWCQLIADATGVETLRSSDPEITARGAYLAGLTATASDVPGYVPEVTRWSPTEQGMQFYAARFEEFLRLRELAREGWSTNEQRQA